MDDPKRPRGIRDSASFWIAVVLAAAIALPLPLMEMFGPVGFLVYAVSVFTIPWLIDLLAVSLFLEAIYRRIPRVLMAIPILTVGAYYAFFIHETLQYRHMVVTVRDGAPSRVAQFDPKTQSLIIPDARDAVAAYDLPVAYEADRYGTLERYQAWLLLPPDQCAAVRKTRTADLISHGGGCLLAVPAQPAGSVVTFEVREDAADGRGGLRARMTSIVAESDGQVISSDPVGFVADRLSLIPWAFFGFVFADGPPSGPPFAGFLWRDTVEVGHVSDAKESSIILPAAAAMLGLRRRAAGGVIPPVNGLDTLLASLPPKPATMAAIADDPLLAAFVAALDNAKVQVTVTEVWGRQVILADVMVDGAKRPTAQMYAYVLKNGAKLAVLRESLIASLSAWQNAGVEETNGWVELVEAVLAKLPAAEQHESR